MRGPQLPGGQAKPQEGNLLPRQIILFTRSKGHGHGNAPLFLPCVLSNTAHLPVQWQHTKPAQLNGWTDTKIPASKTKGKYAGNTPNTLILANRPRSDTASSDSQLINFGLRGIENALTRAMIRI